MLWVIKPFLSGPGISYLLSASVKTTAGRLISLKAGWNLKPSAVLNKWQKKNCKHPGTAEDPVYLRYFLKQLHKDVAGKNNHSQRLCFMMNQRGFGIGMCVHAKNRRQQRKQSAWNHGRLINIHDCKQLSKDTGILYCTGFICLLLAWQWESVLNSPKLLSSSEAQCCRKLFHIYILVKPTGWFITFCNYYIWQIEWRKKG